jgi:hypothetical protein
MHDQHEVTQALEAVSRPSPGVGGGTDELNFRHLSEHQGTLF